MNKNTVTNIQRFDDGTYIVTFLSLAVGIIFGIIAGALVFGGLTG